jgi:hypothetical protein
MYVCMYVYLSTTSGSFWGGTPLIDPHLILNADATQFAVGDTGAENEKVKYIGMRGTKALKVEPRKVNCGIIKYSIKYILLISAAGSSLYLGR